MLRPNVLRGPYFPCLRDKLQFILLNFQGIKGVAQIIPSAGHTLVIRLDDSYEVLIRKSGVNWGVLGVGEVMCRSSCCRFFDLALCDLKWTSDEAQPQTQKSSNLQKEKAPRKGPRTRLGHGFFK